MALSRTPDCLSWWLGVKKLAKLGTSYLDPHGHRPLKDSAHRSSPRVHSSAVAGQLTVCLLDASRKLEDVDLDFFGLRA